jgi:hypothetical protein
MDLTAGFIRLGGEGEGGGISLRDVRVRASGPVVAGGGDSYTFGILIGITPREREGEKIGSVNELPGQYVAVDDFPIVVEYRRMTFAAPPNPVGATAACYVKPRSSKRFFGPMWSDGIVIARHSLKNLGFATGVAVPMVSGASYSVADIDGTSTTIDAAILDCGSVPTSASPLNLASGVGPGNSVDVRGTSGTFTAQVLSVNDHPKYFGRLIAHRVFLDQVGVTGDSGSLVLRSGTGESVGLYMGHTPPPQPEALVQSMRQVVEYFDVDLFD